ncbi:MAG: hypothetical protein D6744_05155, partial [Planctomycetota bacterium]
MSDYPELDEATDHSRAGRVVAMLDIVGWVVLAPAVVVAGMYVYEAGQVGAEGQWARLVFRALAWVLAGGSVSVLMWGLAELIRRSERIQYTTDTAVEHLRRMTQGAAAARAGGGLVGTSELDELVLLLREVRDISLLNDEQRAMRLNAQGRAVLEMLQREVPVLLREHNWIEARNRVQEARERFPSFKEWDALEKQIEQMRTQVEQHDIDAAQRQIQDLTSLGAWDRVDEVLKELLERHPDSQRALDLAQELRSQRNRALAEQRAKLMAQAQEAANNRDWAVALNAATALVQRFPKSPEAQALR